MASPIKSFKIDIPQETLDDLLARLNQTRWTDEPEKDGWKYGTNPAYLRELVTYWQNEYDWRVHETELNKFPHFTTEIDDVNIHFIHVKGKGKNPKPLILTHGWPDSFYRFYKVIGMLTDPESFGGDVEQSFDVVVPSIPGFGFSDPVALSSSKVADLWATLMQDRLGYDSFFASGADLGTGITKSLANNYSALVKAIHLTDVGYPNGTEDWSKMSSAEQKFGRHIQQWMFTEGGYIIIQSNKPQNLGYGLNDSPVGLAAWIIERFFAWSDNKGDLGNSFSKDELLTNIMIYWVTQTINSSMRVYMENARAAWSILGPKSPERVEIPTAVALFPKDAPFPEEWANRMVNVQRFTEMPDGGHFAALEEPELLVDDMRSFFYNDEKN
ncbi:MAG: epoxide hydrolase [Chitinophagaceae bacterium]|nr:epoxide hydrolase [Chitinophagaceae bacterium]